MTSQIPQSDWSMGVVSLESYIELESFIVGRSQRGKSNANDVATFSLVLADLFPFNVVCPFDVLLTRLTTPGSSRI